MWFESTGDTRIGAKIAARLREQALVRFRLVKRPIYGWRLTAGIDDAQDERAKVAKIHPGVRQHVTKVLFLLHTSLVRVGYVLWQARVVPPNGFDIGVLIEVPRDGLQPFVRRVRIILAFPGVLTLQKKVR